MKKNPVKKYTLISFMLLVFTGGFAQDKPLQAFSLNEAVQYALQNNVNAKNAKLDMKKAKAYNWEILSQGLPSLSGSFEYDYYFKTPLVPAFNQYFGANSTFTQLVNRLAYIDGATVPGVGANSTNPNAAPNNKTQGNNPNIPNSIPDILGSGLGFNNISFVLPNDIATGITLSQLIFDGRYLFGLQARKELYLSSRLQSDMSDQDIKNTVTKAYCQAEAAQEAKSHLLENQKIIEKILGDTRAVFAQGLTEELDVNRLELAKTNLDMQINQQNSMAEVALANLKFQMGLDLDANIILKEKLSDLRANLVPQQNTFDPKSRVEYQLLSSAVTLQGYKLKAQRSGYYPSLGGFLNYSGNVQTQAFGDMFKGSNWYPQGIVGIKLNVPIFDSGLKYAQVRQIKMEQMKAQNNLDNFKNAANLQYQAALSTYNAALGDEVNAQKTLDLSKKIYDTNQAKFKQGAGSSFELQQSEQEYTTNELKQIQSIMSLINAKADLDKAMGVK